MKLDNTKVLAKPIKWKWLLINYDMNDICNQLLLDNPKFNKDKFIEECDFFNLQYTERIAADEGE